MPDDQQITIDGYKSRVNEPGKFTNPNEGKPALTEYEEYSFVMKSIPTVRQFDVIKDNRKDGTRTKVTVDKAICEFTEEITGNIVNAFFRIDVVNFSEDESFESGVVRFFRKIGKPIPQSQDIAWSQFFTPGLRFRGRVVVGKDSQTKAPTGRYYLDIPTCRPPAVASQPGAAAPAQATSDAMPASSMMFIIKGARDRSDAVMRLVDAKATRATLDVLDMMINNGTIRFPLV